MTSSKIKRAAVCLAVGAALVLTDQLIKQLVVKCISPEAPLLLIPGVLRLNFVKNTGAMMGFLSGHTELMTVASLAAVAAVIVIMLKVSFKTKAIYVCLVMMTCGGVGNIIDRIFRGYVVDYIEVLFVDFYVFNFADCLVTVGAFLIIGIEFFELVREMKAARAQKGKTE